MKVKKTRLQAQDKGKEVKPEERTSVIAGRRVKAEKSGRPRRQDCRHGTKTR